MVFFELQVISNRYKPFTIDYSRLTIDFLEWQGGLWGRKPRVIGIANSPFTTFPHFYIFNFQIAADLIFAF